MITLMNKGTYNWWTIEDLTNAYPFLQHLLFLTQN